MFSHSRSLLDSRADKLVADLLLEKNVPGSQLPGRPKKWKDKCFEILETSISNKSVLELLAS